MFLGKKNKQKNKQIRSCFFFLFSSYYLEVRLARWMWRILNPVRHFVPEIWFNNKAESCLLVCRCESKKFLNRTQQQKRQCDRACGKMCFKLLQTDTALFCCSITYRVVTDAHTAKCNIHIFRVIGHISGSSSL